MLPPILMVTGPVVMLVQRPDWRVKWAAIGALAVIAAIDITIHVRDQTHRWRDTEASNARMKAKLNALGRSSDTKGK